MYVDCYSLVINNTHGENLINNTTSEVEASINFAATIAKISNIVLTNTSTMQNCVWIFSLNLPYIEIGSIFRTKLSGSTSHLEYIIYASRSADISINSTENLTPDDIYGAKGGQRLTFPSITFGNNVYHLASVTSGGGVLIIDPRNVSYIIMARVDFDGILGFTSHILCVKSRDNIIWTIKTITVNTEETTPSSTHPVTFITSGIIFTSHISGSTQTFDVMKKFIGEIPTFSSWQHKSPPNKMGRFFMQFC